MKVKLSRGNKKLGKRKTLTINLSPIGTCQGMPCFNSGECYCLKAIRQYKNVRAIWMDNYLGWFFNPDNFFKTIEEEIKKRKPKFFRWHSAGEIPSQDYFERMKKIAKDNPKTSFLCYTKRYDLVFGIIPKNLQIIISAYPGIKIKKSLRRRFPIAWFIDGDRENRKLGICVKCPGYCPDCRICWNLSTLDKNVIFKKH